VTLGTTVTANYTYDGLERLALRTTQNMTPAGTTHFLYDRAGRLLVEASSAGTTETEYVWFDDMPLALFANVDTGTPTLFYVHADHLNRPIKMTDVNKTVVWDAIYWPYGATYLITGSATNNMRFPGQYFLLESGLHYNWHRHYDPTIGRYLQVDPLEFVDGPSLYAYANSSPAMKADPEGLQSPSIPIPGTPGIAPIPPVFIPGTPENRKWTDQAIGGAQGLIDQIIKLCRKFGSGDDDCEKQAQSDEAICRSLQRPDVRARCWESANARYGACKAKKPLPPLITW
jgi:RHS repeat-associated protein